MSIVKLMSCGFISNAYPHDANSPKLSSSIKKKITQTVLTEKKNPKLNPSPFIMGRDNNDDGKPRVDLPLTSQIINYAPLLHFLLKNRMSKF